MSPPVAEAEVDLESQPLTPRTARLLWPFAVGVALVAGAWVRVEAKIAGVDEDRARLIRVERKVGAVLCKMDPSTCADAFSGVGP
jgi:hypothetical protein